MSNTRAASASELLTGLEHGLRQVIAQEPVTRSRYMELYSFCYNYCERSYNEIGIKSQNARHELYNRLRNVLETHLQGFTAKSRETTGDDLLKFYAKVWEQYTFSAKIINGIFGYPNRVCIRRDVDDEWKGWIRVYQVALDLWKETIFQEVNARVSKAVFLLFEGERQGQAATGDQVTRIITSFVDLGLNDYEEDAFYHGAGLLPGVEPDANISRVALGTYQRFFEAPLLLEIRDFYIHEITEFLRNNSVSDYIKQAAKRLGEEEARSLRYLRQSSHWKVNQALTKVLIEDQLEDLYKEFIRLLGEEKIEDLTGLYSFVSRLDGGLIRIAQKFREHVVEQGRSKLGGLGDPDLVEPKLFVVAILDTQAHFKRILEKAFAGSSIFTDALNNACIDFVNRNSLTEATSFMKPSELLARYCDEILRKGSKVLKRDELEQRLNDTMIIRFLDDKDIFQKYYSSFLATRIFQKTGSNNETEATMIAKLKICCGFEYTANLQRMFQDIGLSKDLNEEFKKYIRDEKVEGITSFRFL